MSKIQHGREGTSVQSAQEESYRDLYSLIEVSLG